MSTTSNRILCLLLGISGCTASAHEDDLGAQEPYAWVLTPDPGATGEWLERAGFAVAPLPLDRPPLGLPGVIVLGAEASDMPEYQRYMQAHAAGLSGFVERGGLLLQLAQSAEAEPAPPFLPATLMARRGPGDPGRARTRVDHPLLAEWPSAAWDADGDVFVAHAGFAGMVAEVDADAVLLAACHGRGEIVLAALALDRPRGEDPERDALAEDFAADLARHVACAGVCAASEPFRCPGSW